MKKIVFALILSCCMCVGSLAQYHSKLSAGAWVDSVFRSLSDDERIAQLIAIRAHSNLGQDHVDQVTDLIRKYNVGALVFFQGDPYDKLTSLIFTSQLPKPPS